MKQAIMLFVMFFVIATYSDNGVSEPLGGWETFPGPVTECSGSDCK